VPTPERIGSVEATDPRDAVERALMQYAICERERWRISVRRKAQEVAAA
jgi:hypothetical protein